MDYDYQLVGGALLLMFGIVGMANAFVEQRVSFSGLICLGSGFVLVAWAWILSEAGLNIFSVPDAVFRLLANWT